MAEQTKRQQLETHLAMRAMQDPDFRERLLREPKRAIESEIGLKFPEGVQVAVHEEKLNQLYVILPVELMTWEDLLPPDITTDKVAGDETRRSTGPASPQRPFDAASDKVAADDTPFWKKIRPRKAL
jgi:hypothetical protein